MAALTPPGSGPGTGGITAAGISLVAIRISGTAGSRAAQLRPLAVTRRTEFWCACAMGIPTLDTVAPPVPPLRSSAAIHQRAAIMLLENWCFCSIAWPSTSVILHPPLRMKRHVCCVSARFPCSGMTCHSQVQERRNGVLFRSECTGASTRYYFGSTGIFLRLVHFCSNTPVVATAPATRDSA